MYLELGDLTNAEMFVKRAVRVFEITCGADSPLVASAESLYGTILWKKGDREGCRIALMTAYTIEATRDGGINISTLMDLNQQIMDTFVKPMPSQKSSSGANCSPPPLIRENFKSVLSVALKACENINLNLPQDGDAAAFYKTAAEVAIYANELREAKRLLELSVPLFACDTRMDCSELIARCQEMITLIDGQVR